MPNNIREINEIKTPSNEVVALAKKEEAPSSFSWDVLYFLLLDTVNTQLDLSVTRAKSQQLNVDKQMELNAELDKIQLKTIPASCWGQVKEYTMKRVKFWTFKHGHYWYENVQVTKGYRKTIVDKAKYNPVIIGNQQQMKMRQDIQNSIAVLQMRASTTSTSADNAIKCSSQATAVDVGLIDVLMTLTDRINNKR